VIKWALVNKPEFEMKNYKQKIKELGFSVMRGGYHGTTDDRIDRWYVEHPATDCVDHRGSGFKTLRDAYHATAEVVMMWRVDEEEIIRSETCSTSASSRRP